MPIPEFSNVYVKMLDELLTINDLKILAQLIDISGKIIFNVQDLTRLIGVFIGCPEELISINLLPIEEVGCLSKAPHFLKLT